MPLCSRGLRRATRIRNPRAVWVHLYAIPSESLQNSSGEALSPRLCSFCWGAPVLTGGKSDFNEQKARDEPISSKSNWNHKIELPILYGTPKYDLTQYKIS